MGCAGVFLMLFPGWLRCSPDAFQTVCEVYRAQLHFKNIIHILSPATSYFIRIHTIPEVCGKVFCPRNKSCAYIAWGKKAVFVKRRGYRSTSM